MTMLTETPPWERLYPVYKFHRLIHPELSWRTWKVIMGVTWKQLAEMEARYWEEGNPKEVEA